MAVPYDAYTTGNWGTAMVEVVDFNSSGTFTINTQPSYGPSLITEQQQLAIYNAIIRNEEGRMFDEKKPWCLYRVSPNQDVVKWFEKAEDAEVAAQNLITGDKSQRFVILKATKAVEAEPVKTRTRELG